jgi:hypothetical protein
MAISQDASVDTDNMKLPGTVFTPRQVRMLKYVVVGLGIVLVIGFLLVIVGMAYTASQIGKGSATAAAPAAQIAAVPKAADSSSTYQVAIPQGAEVLGTSLSGDRLAITLKTENGPEIMVVDLRRGRILSQLILRPRN